MEDREKGENDSRVTQAWALVNYLVRLQSSTSVGSVMFELKGSRYLSCAILPGPPQGYNDVQLGSTFTKNFGSNDFMAFDPFAEAGVEEQDWCPGPPGFWRAYEYNWCYLKITPISGDNIRIYGYGATANNNTNDPAAIIPMKMD